MQENGKREMVMASHLVTEAYQESRHHCEVDIYEVVVEISESGWADLSRLQLLATRWAESDADRSVNMLPYTIVESIRVHNTRELIRGQGDGIGAPAGVFSPFRQYGPIQLGKWWLEGGNTVSVRLRSDLSHLDPEESSRFAYSVAFPFSPDNHRVYKIPQNLEERSCGYVASPAHCYSKSLAHAEIRFDQDGIVDLDSLQVQTHRGQPDEYHDNISNIVIESIELPTRQELILGGNSAEPLPRAVPAAIFASLGRRFEWVRFGFLEVSTNNTLTVRLKNHSHRGSVAVGLQFFPSKKQGF